MALSGIIYCLALVTPTFGTPLGLQNKVDSSLNQRDTNASLFAYSLPQNDGNLLRATDVTTKQTTFLYGPPPGAGPYYPAGPLGTTYVAADSLITDSELAVQVVISNNDSTFAKADGAKYNGLQTLDDYTKLYDAEWQPSSRPTGQDPGILTNYTQDLLFSMERLSFNPYAVRRLDPAVDSLPFTIDDATSINVTGQTLSSLFSASRLFYADHRNQSSLPRTDRYAAACDAYFYISPSSGDFLPLAIRTNFGNNLIYTPNDTPNDWLLAKIMYNVNDFFMAQLDHFSRNHFTTELVYEAAIRTLSDDHPVLAILERLMYGAFGIRPLALIVLIRPGGDFDQYFGYTGTAAAQFSDATYANGYAGAIQANYFRTNLQRRGLIYSTKGPALKSFPFYEDAAPLFDALRTFTGAFVSSYYSSNADVTADKELQAFVTEANGPAGVIDFPSSITTPATLADFLAEFARLGSISHHAVNLNQLITAAATLPFHPSALYKPIPSQKGVTDVAAYLPPLDKCLGMIGVAADFARSYFAGGNRTMVHMFDDPVMLARMNEKTRQANEVFKGTMLARSRVVKGRGFDARGLSQGMPFVWKALDPDVMAWSSSI